jgi:hypothetical protein
MEAGAENFVISGFSGPIIIIIFGQSYSFGLFPKFEKAG